MPAKTAPIGMHNAEQRIEQFALAHALQRRYSDDFARPHGKGEVGHLLADAKAIHLKRRRAGMASRFTARRINSTNRAADHQPHYLIVAHIVEPVRADMPAISHDRHALAQVGGPRPYDGR